MLWINIHFCRYCGASNISNICPLQYFKYLQYFQHLQVLRPKLQSSPMGGRQSWWEWLELPLIGFTGENLHLRLHICTCTCASSCTCTCTCACRSAPAPVIVHHPCNLLLLQGRGLSELYTGQERDNWPRVFTVQVDTHQRSILYSSHIWNPGWGCWSDGVWAWFLPDRPVEAKGEGGDASTAWRSLSNDQVPSQPPGTSLSASWPSSRHRLLSNNNKPSPPTTTASHSPTTLPWPGYSGQPSDLKSLRRREASSPQLRRRWWPPSPDSAASASKPFLLPLLLLLIIITSHQHRPTLSRLPVCSGTPFPSWIPPPSVHSALQQEAQSAISHRAPGKRLEPPGSTWKILEEGQRPLWEHKARGAKQGATAAACSASKSAPSRSPWLQTPFVTTLAGKSTTEPDQSLYSNKVSNSRSPTEIKALFGWRGIPSKDLVFYLALVFRFWQLRKANLEKCEKVWNK